MKWISVKDNLPDVAFEYVWVCYQDGRKVRVDKGHHLNDTWWANDKMTISYTKITHWMFITPPMPPENITTSVTDLPCDERIVD